MSHPLLGCELRFNRANRYISEANDILEQFARQCEALIVKSQNADGTYRDIGEFPDIPSDLALAISDCVHNLRAALDYLVYQLAIHDSKGVIQEGTQFPIESIKIAKAPSGHYYGFDAVKDRFLRGVNEGHRDVIERLQPYNGCNWSKTLKDISNPDKHRHLTTVITLDTIHGWNFGPLRGHHNVGGTVLPNGDTIQADPAQTVHIQLPDGLRPIVQTLHHLHAGVVDTINAFKPEFKI